MMDKIVHYLLEIQEDLVGIVIPVIITAFISLITIIVDLIFKIVVENRKYNSEQYKYMQEFYPELKTKLYELKYDLHEIENNPMFGNRDQAIEKYIKISDDEQEYRSEHTDERLYIDTFKKSMNSYREHIIEIETILSNHAIPSAPIMHPCLKKSINKMLFAVQCNSVLWKKSKCNEISNEVFNEELKRMNEKGKICFDSKMIEKYIQCLDKWFSKY